MTRYDSSAWVAKANKRKAYRDHTRDKFFASVGLSKGESTYSQSGAPQSQQKTVLALLDLTLSSDLVDSNHSEMIRLVASTMASLDFGKGVMGGQAATDQNLAAYAMKSMRDNWFWSPAFFD